MCTINGNDEYVTAVAAELTGDDACKVDLGVWK